MKKIKKILKGVLVGTLLVVCLAGCEKDTAHYVEQEDTQMQQTETDVVESKPADEKFDSQMPDTQIPVVEVCVYVCGQVKYPGVYTLSEGSRVCDLFKRAGGLTDFAAAEYWNQARLLIDGEMIYVPTAEEAKDREWTEGVTSQNSTDDPDKININTASKEELMTLPGIGEAKADAILSYRKENGPFSTIEELKQVEGIKDGVFSKMKDYIEIN